jgi:BCD family chlorophyll transporter-like MFS transporter
VSVLRLIRRRGLIVGLDWTQIATRYLPFADAASPDLPLARLARLALFQVSVGMATALMVGTLNRVMIVELGVGAWLVALMVALPLLVAPLRALVGFRSDTHRSFLGWKRVPFIWFGTLLQFGGLAIMPFALILLTGTTPLQLWSGHAAAALAFLLAGAGLQTAQTAGLALATDLASEASRPRVVALMYVMLLLGMLGAAAVFGVALAEYSHTRLVQVVQGAAVATVLLNGIALWKQEPRSARRPRAAAETQREDFRATWARFAGQPRTKRFLVAVGLGTAAFSMQDIILEPYGAEVLNLPVGATTLLTALMAGGAIAAFALAARRLARGADPYRVAAGGAVVGLAAFSAVIFADPLASPLLFRAGAVLIGFGAGLFSVGTLTAAMGLDTPAADGRNHHGLVLGAWGAVQACCAGAAIALGGVLRDAVNGLAHAGLLGEALAGPGAGYGVVYHLELLLLFATLIAVGPLVRRASAAPRPASPEKFGLADLPG